MSFLVTRGLIALRNLVASTSATFLLRETLRTILGTDVEIIPCFWGAIRMRNHDDNNGIWAEIIRIMKSKVSDEALQLPN